MYTRVFALASLLVSGAVAAENWSRVDPVTLRALRVRQGGESFQPGQNSGFGETCADAFGAGYEQCGNGKDCYDPTDGETCCKEGYPCPSGSFCLTQGYCCPEGLDPETCAQQHGITLTSSASSTASATPIPPATVTPSSTPSPSSNHTVLPTGVPTGPTGGSSPSITPEPFPGAASRQGVAMGAVAALGALALFI